MQAFMDEVWDMLEIAGRPVFDSSDPKYKRLVLKAAHEWCDRTFALKSDRIEFTAVDTVSAYPLSNSTCFEYPVQTIRAVTINSVRLEPMTEVQYRNNFQSPVMDEADGIPSYWWAEGDTLYFDKGIKAADFVDGWISGSYYPKHDMEMDDLLPIPFAKLLSCQTYVVGRIMAMGAPTQDQLENAKAMIQLGIDSAELASRKANRQVASTQYRQHSRSGTVNLGR